MLSPVRRVQQYPLDRHPAWHNIPPALPVSLVAQQGPKRSFLPESVRINQDLHTTPTNLERKFRAAWLAKDTECEIDLLYRIGAEKSPPYHRRFDCVPRRPYRVVKGDIRKTPRSSDRSETRIFLLQGYGGGQENSGGNTARPGNRQQGESVNQTSHHVWYIRCVLVELIGRWYFNRHSHCHHQSTNSVNSHIPQVRRIQLLRYIQLASGYENRSRYHYQTLRPSLEES